MGNIRKCLNWQVVKFLDLLRHHIRSNLWPLAQRAVTPCWRSLPSLNVILIDASVSARCDHRHSCRRDGPLLPEKPPKSCRRWSYVKVVLFAGPSGLNSDRSQSEIPIISATSRIGPSMVARSHSKPLISLLSMSPVRCLLRLSIRGQPHSTKDIAKHAS